MREGKSESETVCVCMRACAHATPCVLATARTRALCASEKTKRERKSKSETVCARAPTQPPAFYGHCAHTCPVRAYLRNVRFPRSFCCAASSSTQPLEIADLEALSVGVPDCFHALSSNAKSLPARPPDAANTVSPLPLQGKAA